MIAAFLAATGVSPAIARLLAICAAVLAVLGLSWGLVDHIRHTQRREDLAAAQEALQVARAHDAAAVVSTLEADAAARRVDDQKLNGELNVIDKAPGGDRPVTDRAILDAMGLWGTGARSGPPVNPSVSGDGRGAPSGPQ
jgi:hypothetical protein